MKNNQCKNITKQASKKTIKIKALTNSIIYLLQKIEHYLVFFTNDHKNNIKCILYKNKKKTCSKNMRVHFFKKILQCINTINECKNEQKKQKNKNQNMRGGRARKKLKKKFLKTSTRRKI